MAHRNENGAVLVLALVFILAVGLLMGVLVNLVSTNMLATGNLTQERSLEYASDAALEMAVQAVRYAPEGSTPCNMPASAGLVPIVHFTGGQNGDLSSRFNYTGNGDLGVWCTQSDHSEQRQVIFCAGPGSMDKCTTPAAPGELARAQVLFEDIAPNGMESPGIAMSIESWSIDVASH